MGVKEPKDHGLKLNCAFLSLPLLSVCSAGKQVPRGRHPEHTHVIPGLCVYAGPSSYLPARASYGLLFPTLWSVISWWQLALGHRGRRYTEKWTNSTNWGLFSCCTRLPLDSQLASTLLTLKSLRFFLLWTNSYTSLGSGNIPKYLTYGWGQIN